MAVHVLSGEEELEKRKATARRLERGSLCSCYLGGDTSRKTYFIIACASNLSNVEAASWPVVVIDDNTTFAVLGYSGFVTTVISLRFSDMHALEILR